MEKALTLQQAADQLGLSYSTVFAKREHIAFRLPGSRVWRVWPSQLASLTEKGSNVTRLSLRVDTEKPCQSAKIKKPASGTSISARQAAKELDALLERPTAKRHRNTMTA